MTASLGHRHAPGPARARGQAMLLTVLLLGVGASAIVYSLATPGKEEVASDKTTAAALAQARDALIGHAASHQAQPGILPCPDNDNDGSADAPCGALGVTAIGKLPWRTLGIPPLRDGAGECLWYAVSANFKNSGLSGPAVVNSDSAGTLTVRDSTGAAVLSGANAVLAVVFAPGPALPGQDRSPGAASICGGNTNAANYLDTYTVGALNFNNATGSGTNDFVNPSSMVQFGQINDRLLPITSEALFSVVNARVAKDALYALEAYKAANGILPPANSYGTAAPYYCTAGVFRGRFPITMGGGTCSQPDWPASVQPIVTWFANNDWNLVTHYATSGTVCGPIPPIYNVWPIPVLFQNLCDLNGNTQGLLNAINVILASLLLPPITLDDPITVTGISSNVKMLVIVSGRALGAQVHTCGTAAQCLEDAENANGDGVYVKPSRFPTSNDRLGLVCGSLNPCPMLP